MVSIPPIVYVTLVVTCAALAARISLAGGLAARLRWAWRLVALSCLLNLSGAVLWIVDRAFHLGRPAAGLSIADLVAYPVLLAALLLFPQALRFARDTLKFSLDAAIVVVGGGMLVWHVAVAPAVESQHGSWLLTVISVAHPIANLLMLFGLATIVLRCPPGRRRRPMLLLAASIAALLAADLVGARLALAGSGYAGEVRHAGDMAQYLLLAMSLAAELRRLSDAQPDSGAPPAGVPVGALPYAAITTGYGVLLVVAQQDRGEIFDLVIGAMLLTVLVVVRQVIAVRENLVLQHERALRAGEARFRSLVQHASDIVAIVGPDSTFSFVSPSASRTLGRAPADLVGTAFLDLVHPDDAVDARTRITELVQNPGRLLEARWRLGHHDGTWITTDNTGVNLLADDSVRGLLMTTRDVTDRCRLEAELAHQAFHDSLTGLANRPLFLDRVRHELTRRPAERPPVAVLYVDLDHFKPVNDSLGHDAGDTLLVLAAERLGGCLRTFDTAARLGADEFAVLLENVYALEDVTGIADRITRAFAEPFQVDGHELIVSASVGIARAAMDQSADDLVRNADLAMYLAKSRGRAQSALFEPAMHTVAVARLELIGDLRHAIERNELVVVYMPIHALDTQALVGVEALLRWNHPTRGDVPPLTFIPLAEESGLITSIGRWVLEQACRDTQRWRSTIPQLEELTVAVNLSGRQIPEPSLLLDIQRALDESGLPPEALVLELTESILLDHTEQAQAVMDCLKMLGVGLAIDDFGTGYSSLSYLQQLPLDILKIDRSFVERMAADGGGDGLARAVIALATTLALRTVAEGIEHAEQSERLRALGCHRGQGYFYSPALPAGELEAYARRAIALLAD